MLMIFTKFADLIVYGLMGLTPGTRLAQSIHFFFRMFPRYMFSLSL